MQTYVIVATKGRPREVVHLVADLALQTCPPEAVIVVCTDPSDVTGLDISRYDTGRVAIVTVEKPGLTRQRNAGIAKLIDTGAISATGEGLVVFFDDDFRPARDWLEQAAAAFASRPDAVALGGALLLNETGTSEEHAAALIEKDAIDRQQAPAAPVQGGDGLYGCNMAVPGRILVDTRFDEGLPLYSWLEDADFSIRLKRRGMIVYAPACRGVHLNTVGGRIGGVRFGYSQIANPVYLTRRGSMPAGVTLKLVAQAFTANVYRCLRRRPGVDHPGRLRGNLRAVWDMARRRDAPDRILQLPG